MVQVVALVHEENGGFGISFPDFPGCVSGGETLEEALVRGQATLAFHVAGMAEDGDPLPAVRSFDELRHDRDFKKDRKEAIVTMVPLDLPGKAVRLNISMDDRLVEQVDRAAEAAGQSRSAFLAAAAKARLRSVA